MAKLYSELIQKEIELTDELERSINTLAGRLTEKMEKEFSPEKVMDVALRGFVEDGSDLNTDTISAMRGFIEQRLQFQEN